MQDNQDRTARTGQFAQDRQHRTTRTGQPITGQPIVSHSMFHPRSLSLHLCAICYYFYSVEIKLIDIDYETINEKWYLYLTFLSR